MMFLSILCTKTSWLHLLLHFWILNDSFQKLFCLCFVFTPNISWTFIHPPQRPFTRRLGLEKKGLLSPLLQAPSLSLTLSANLGSIKMSTCCCVCPLNGLKVSPSPSIWENTGFLANRTWDHFCLQTFWTSHKLGWPSPSRKNSCTSLDILPHFYCQTLRDCSVGFWLCGQLWRVVCLLKCYTEESMPCNHFHAIVHFLFGSLVLLHLTSVLSISEKKWTDSIKLNIPI